MAMEMITMVVILVTKTTVVRTMMMMMTTTTTTMIMMMMMMMMMVVVVVMVTTMVMMMMVVVMVMLLVVVVVMVMMMVVMGVLVMVMVMMVMVWLMRKSTAVMVAFQKFCSHLFRWNIRRLKTVTLQAGMPLRIVLSLVKRLLASIITNKEEAKITHTCHMSLSAGRAWSAINRVLKTDFHPFNSKF